MTEAIFGLAGVVIGAIVSGGVAYFMARRTEQLKARASARLLYTETTRIVSGLEVLKRAAEPYPAPRDIAPRGGLTLLRLHQLDQISSGWNMDVWREHQPILAEVLDGESWVKVNGAWTFISILKERSGLLLGEQEPSMIKLSFESGLDATMEGVDALHRLSAQ
jgi:hypothetical protein